MLVPAARRLADEMEARRSELAALVISFEDHRTARRLGLAVHAAAVGDPPRVLELLDPLADLPDDHSANDPGYWRWHDLFADTLIDTGELEVAKRFIARYLPVMDALGRPSMKAQLTRCHGRIAWAQQQRRESVQAFEDALEQVRVLSMPYDEARCEVEYAQVLRRNGRRRLAAEHLTAAKQRLQPLGWTSLLERCETELAACGLTQVRRSRAELRSALTPRERAVAQLAAAGESNRTIAAQLMLSVKTVENHLTHIFSKCGVHSRAELARALRSITDPD